MTRTEIIKEIWKEIPMKARYFVFFILGILLTALVCAVGCSNFRKYVPEDGIVEELTECIIEKSLDLPDGVLDLSPDSPEG